MHYHLTLCRSYTVMLLISFYDCHHSLLLETKHYWIHRQTNIIVQIIQIKIFVWTANAMKMSEIHCQSTDSYMLLLIYNPMCICVCRYLVQMHAIPAILVGRDPHTIPRHASTSPAHLLHDCYSISQKNTNGVMEQIPKKETTGDLSNRLEHPTEFRQY